VLYLKDKPTRETLEHLVSILEDPVADLVRKDSQFKKLGLDEADYVDAEPVIDLLVAKPRLLQRPIVVRGDKAMIGRPKERIRALLG
jgi:arsenate reductase